MRAADKMAEAGIPEHMHYGLSLYIEKHVMPGHFLQAVLENDLKEAVSRADDQNIAALKAYVTYLYCHAPATCWGSRAKVSAWLKEAEE